jgi:AI-2E family transporter
MLATLLLAQKQYVLSMYFCNVETILCCMIPVCLVLSGRSEVRTNEESNRWACLIDLRRCIAHVLLVTALSVRCAFVGEKAGRTILLITVLLVGILFWLSSKVIVVLLILLVAALLAYAVVPLIDRLHRFMPRALAMVLVYVVAIALFGLLAYLTIKTLIPQLKSVAQSVQTFVKPGSNGQDSPLDQMFKSVGFTQSQINSATKHLQSQLSSSAADVAKGTEQFIGGLISAGFNILLTVVSIYLLVDGYRFGSWLINSSPLSQRGRVSSILENLQRVVGGYIRGQIIMSSCMGVLQFVGMAILGVPYAPLVRGAGLSLRVHSEDRYHHHRLRGSGDCLDSELATCADHTDLHNHC